MYEDNNITSTNQREIGLHDISMESIINIVKNKFISEHDWELNAVYPFTRDESIFTGQLVNKDYSCHGLAISRYIYREIIFFNEL